MGWVSIMDKKDITNCLAGRMGSSFEQAETWLEAVLDTLSGAYSVEDAATDIALDGIDLGAAAEHPPILRSVTPTARLSIGDEIALDRFPFRVGREGRMQVPANGLRGIIERCSTAPAKTNNELYVKDFGKSVNVSREHFQIEAKDDGSYELVDRGSACGTIVSDQVVGGNFLGGRCTLNFGDSIIVGTRQSTIVFEFCQASA